jgi:transcriptional regulator with XRE-family HTH domain
MTNLKKMRKRRGLKLCELAKLLGVTPQSVFQQERDGIIKTTTAQHYAVALDCDPRDLLDWK